LSKEDILKAIRSAPKTRHAKTTIIKTLLEENQKTFENYADLKKIRSIEKKNKGTSIIVQNNFHMPRPGDDKDERPVDQKIEEIEAKYVDKS